MVRTAAAGTAPLRHVLKKLVDVLRLPLQCSHVLFVLRFQADLELPDQLVFCPWFPRVTKNVPIMGRCGCLVEPIMVSHAVFCTRIASSRSTGTSNSSRAAHFIATAALRCSKHKHIKLNQRREEHVFCINVRLGVLPLRSAQPRPEAACACLTACSLK